MTKKAISKQTSLRNMKFNRYLMIRYFTAGYFFVNLYWLILLVSLHKITWLLPASLLIGLVGVCCEQVKQYQQPSQKLPLATFYYWLQLGINVLLLISLYTPLFNAFYPFVKPTGKILMLLILLVGCLGCLVLERRLHLILHNKDRYYQALKDFEALI